MFDYRYHALSLAAVLFALALGVLIGVAIGDSNLVSSAKNGIVQNLNSEVSDQRATVARLQERLGNEQAFANGLYPLAVHELLGGRSIGLVFLGESSDQVNSLVRASVTEAGGNTEMRIRSAAASRPGSRATTTRTSGGAGRPGSGPTARDITVIRNR